MSNTVVADNVLAPGNIAYNYFNVLADIPEGEFAFAAEPTPSEEEFVLNVKVNNFAGHSKQVIKYILSQILRNGNPDHDTYFTVTGIERA